MANEVRIGTEVRSEDWHAGRGADCGCTERVRKLNAKLNAALPTIDMHRARCFTEVWKENEGESPIMLKALGTYKHLSTVEPYIEDGELIVGLEAPRPKCHPMHPEVDIWWLEDEGGIETLSKRTDNPFYPTDEDIRIYKEEILPYWKNKTVYAKWKHLCPEEISKRVVGTGFADASFNLCVLGSHEVLDWPNILSNGMGSIRDAAKEKLASLDIMNPDLCEKIEYYKAVIMEIDGVEVFANNYAKKLTSMAAAEADPKRKAELERTAAACAWVPIHPARSFFEALQSMWMTFCVITTDSTGPLFSIGRFDQIFWEYYKHDVIDEGILTRDEALELVELFFLKFNNTMFFADAGTSQFFTGTAVFQNLQVGGVDRYGNDATNDLSYLAIDAMIDIRTIQPSFSVRLHEGSPEKLRLKTIELAAAGMGHPSVYNDAVAIKTMMMCGHDWHEANDYTCGGCMEIQRMGHYFWGPGCQIDLGMAVDLAITQGVKRQLGGGMQGEQLGCVTPDPRTMKTYQEFEDAVLTHVKEQVDYLYASIGYMLEAYQDYPLILQSVLGGLGMERGLPHLSGGLDYSSFPGMNGTGIADIGNSLAAVKKLVFEDKSITMDQLIDALDADFEGYENVRQMCVDAPKYGNDDDYVDSLTKHVLDVLGTYVKTKPGLLAKYDPDQATAKIRHQVGCALAPVASNIGLGLNVGALPSGRKAGEPLADSLGAYAGTDHEGPTAVLKSVAKMNAERFHGVIVNLYVSKQSMESKEGRKRVSDMVQAYFDQGGAHIQFNIQDKKVLKDAQVHPDKYPTLIVRVAGYSAYFTELGKPTQDAIIARTQHDV